jgi:hypothetical protein
MRAISEQFRKARRTIMQEYPNDSQNNAGEY